MSASASPERLPLATSDLAAERLARLHELLPGAFSEGRLVPEKLAELVGAKAVSAAPERYGLSYAGRAEALREMLAASHGTLRPDRAASLNWEATENLIVEGDNLHVLKLLQSAYAGAVKLIYIDPPYNTGNDFVYPDDFRAGLKHYKELTQQSLSTNAETSGRYHSDWLKMMHPRLALARNLLRDDGVIFVSIDDHEVHNLRLLMDEVFGEENFVGEIVWKGRQFPDARAGSGLSTDHEYLVAYSWNAGVTLRGVPRDESKFENPDNDSRGVWMSRSLLGLAHKEARPNLHYPITDPKTGHTFVPPADTGWRYAKDRMEKMIGEGKVLFPLSPAGRPREKKFRSELESENKAFPSIIDDVFTSGGTKDIRELFGADVIQFPKPAELLRRIVAQVAGPSDLILDFFAGSGTTAQAVLELNRQDAGDRKFILVQFPEPTGREDFPTIADITRERVRRVVRKLNAEDAEAAKKARSELPLSAHSATSASRIRELGFRAYRLEESNFKLWDADAAPTDGAALAQQLELMAHNVLEDRGDDDLLAELLLKCGHPGVTLTSPVEVREVAGAAVHLLAEGRLAICLARTLTQELLRGILALQPQRVLCLDVGFQGNDQLKTNTVLEMKSHGVQFQTV